VKARATVLAEDRLASLIVSPVKQKSNPLEMLLGGGKPRETALPAEEEAKVRGQKDEVRQQLLRGEIEDLEIEIEVEDAPPPVEINGSSLNIGDMMGGMLPKRTKMRRMKVSEARKVLIAEEEGKLIDMDAVTEEALSRAEQDGIVFIDEIDKIAGRSTGGHGPDVSREGVQRDILPIVEGSTVNTKYGPVRTDFMLFIAAGAFHVAKVTDLIPELQGRFPVHAVLKSLTRADFRLILTQPENALTHQYAALLAVDHVKLRFDDSALDVLSEAAWLANENDEDIGARRLVTIFEKLLDDISFNADGSMPEVEIAINGDYVRRYLGDAATRRDLRQFIL
jgi:ATP-dependent HslUV protease ATP-binding subunit HslU